MGSTTPIYALPYPAGSDRVRDGDNAIQALAERVEAVLPTGLVPVGVVVPFAGGVAPAGWILADGRLVSRAAYPVLFGVIGTTYGGGDGSTTFGLPNLQSRVPLGAGTGAGLRARAAGAAGGGEDSVASHAHGMGTESADHAHGGQTAGQSADHSHTVPMADAGGLGGGGTLVRKGGTGTNGTYGASNDHSHAFSTGGRNAAHVHDVYAAGAGDGNMPPFMVLNYIIRAA